jgi:tetratricopeptide (TPR) repeat protein
MDFCHLAILLATTSGNTKRHSQALSLLARIHWQLGDYLAVRLHACEAQRLARISANSYGEARVLWIEAVAWTSLGNYKQSISLCTRARELKVLCGMTSGGSIMNHQAQIHLVKSEYREAHKIQTQILQECPVHWVPYVHAVALLNLAEIGLSMNAPKYAVQQDIERTKKIFVRIVEITMCDMILADLHFREGDISTAKTLFKTCFRACNHSLLYWNPDDHAFALLNLTQISLPYVSNPRIWRKIPKKKLLGTGTRLY